MSVIVRPRRPAGLGAAAVLLGLTAAAAGGARAASAQEGLTHEPLFLRIHPRADGVATAGREADAVALEMRAARAAREAVWERSNARARLAIASVCTGCIPAPERRSPDPPDPAQPASGPAPQPEPVIRPEAAGTGRLAATDPERGEP